MYPTSWRGSRARPALALLASLVAGGAWAQVERYRELEGALEGAEGFPQEHREPVLERAGVLDRGALVAAVLARNPSVAAARAAARAALHELPQVTGLEDPMLMYEVAPLTVTSPEARFGQAVRLEQRFPFPGKLRLRGEVALADALAVERDLEATRLRLALATSQLFDDWYVVHRALGINEEHLELLRTLKKSAEAQFTVGKAAQQDPLQAEVEIAQLLHEALVLSAERATLRARLNGLLCRDPQIQLPPPPPQLPVSLEEPPPSEALQARALERRPALASLAARIGGRQAAVSLARRSYLPDLGVMGTYNSMWMSTSHQYMVGVTLNLPLYLGKRRAAVEQAHAALTQAEAEQVRESYQVRVEVEQARAQLVEALRAVPIFRSRILPAVRDQVEAARVGFEAGRNSFLAVIEAEKNLRTLQLRFEQVLADVERRRAALDRAVGVFPGLEPLRQGERR